MQKIKRGQFYIIAAIIIIIVVIGFVGIKNYVIGPQKSTKIYDLGKELKLETGQVIDYGIYKINDEEEFDVLVENWVEKYYDYTIQQGIEGDWIFIYGDQEEIHVLNLTSVSGGEVSIGFGQSSSGISPEVNSLKSTTIKVPEGEEEVVLTFQNLEYLFNLRKGENFYFVVKVEGFVSQG